MYLLATASAEFVQYWSEIIDNRAPVVRVDTIPALHAFLNMNKVELVVLDMSMEESQNPEVLRNMVRTSPGSRLILAGVPFSPAEELTGLAVGAVACCPPHMPKANCQKIIDVVLNGGVWLSSGGIPELIEKLRQYSTQHEESHGAQKTKSFGNQDILEKLTKREKEVAQLIGDGATNKEIAKRLFISDRTVKSHLSTIFDKLHVQDRLQLALLVTGKTIHTPQE